MTVVEKIRESIKSAPTDGELEEIYATPHKYTLADAIREGSKYTTQSYNWGHGESACALSAAALAAQAHGYIEG